MTDESDKRVGYLNTTLARGGGNLSDSNFKSSIARALLRMRRNVFCFNCKELEHKTDSCSEEVNYCIYRVPGHIMIDLRPELFTTLRIERKPVREDVKRSCVRLAQKYLSLNAFRFTNLSRRLMNFTTIKKCRHAVKQLF